VGDDDIAFATSGDVNIAYRVVGGGPVDLVYIQGFLTHLGVYWEQPAFRSYCEQIGRFARLILFDKRGMGLSDRVPGAVPLEERMDDVRAILDDLGSERAALMGESEGGPLAILFAAAHPGRTASLILQGAEVRERTDADWPWGEATREEFDHDLPIMVERWGKDGSNIDNIAPSAAGQPWLQEWWKRVLINSTTPRAGEGFMRMAFDIDVRGVVPSISVPTLVLHSVGDRVCDVENGRFLARTIRGAQYIERPGDDHVPWFAPEPVLSEIREFLTGMREPSEPERVLATVLFTDVVDSTRLAATVGDRRFRELLQAHHAAVRHELARFGGTELDTAGDGFLASFDGPARAIRCAHAAMDAVRPLGLRLRAGLHTGEVERLASTLAGIAVHIGARIAALADPGEILVSRTVRDLVSGSGIEFEDRGSHVLKGVPDEWQVYAVVNA
jgi:class 3 adenylate cyclase/pimeloyl-ACP methyl ester carboxylesterase